MENGAKVKDIQARLGHSRSAITIDTYSHLTQKMQNESVDIFEKAMRDIRITCHPTFSSGATRVAKHYFPRFAKHTNRIPTTFNPHPSSIQP